MIIDTHSHIYDSAFDDDRDQVVARAKQAGVERIVLPGIDSQYNERMMALAASDPQFFCPMVGLHPTSVNDNPRWREELSEVEEILNSNKSVVGIGEIGLDLYWSRDCQTQQQEAFEVQLELALKHNLPVVIHTRNAWNEMCDTLERYKGRGLKAVMHAFAGSEEDYRKLRECGQVVFGIGGVVTYKKSEIAALLPRMSLDEIVLETDAPYLPPVPYRGKRNESSHIIYVCAKVAELWGVTESEVARRTTLNAKRVLGI